MSELTGQLSKRIPERIKTVKFSWINKEFLIMSQRYRAVRPKSRPLDTCFWCGHKFADGEQMALAAREKGANVVLCATCSDEALEKDDG